MPVTGSIQTGKLVDFCHLSQGFTDMAPLFILGERGFGTDDLVIAEYDVAISQKY